MDDKGSEAPRTPTANTENTTNTENIRQIPSDEETASLEILQRLWIKDDTTWDTTKVMGPYSKQLRAFSEDYKHRQVKLLGHVIRADNIDPMRKVTFKPNTVRQWCTPLRRVGRPKEQWIQGAKNQAWKKCRHMEDKQGSKNPNKRTKYKKKPLQEAYLHLWAGERQF